MTTSHSKKKLMRVSVKTHPERLLSTSTGQKEGGFMTDLQSLLRHGP